MAFLESIFGPDKSDGPSFVDSLVAQGRSLSGLLHGSSLSGTGPLDINTGTSSIDAGTGRVNIDPSIGERSLTALDKFTGSLTDTRSALLGNKNAFNQARVAPLMETLERGRGSLERELGQTGVRGTFRERSLQDYDIAGEKALGDQRAFAEQESINAINTIDQMDFSATQDVNNNMFDQQLKQLGLGVDTIRIIRSIAQGIAATGINAASNTAALDAGLASSRAENVSGFIGNLLTP